MASAGLQIWNNDDFIQIDANYANYSMVKKGTIQTTAGNNDWDDRPPVGPALITLSNGSNPMLAIKPRKSTRVQRWKTGNTWYFKLLVDGGDAWNTEPLPAVPYYIFDKPPTTATPNGYGLQVWNEQGLVVFDSMFKYMRVVDVINQDGTFPYVGGSNRTYKYAGKEVAVITCQQGYYVFQDSGSPAGQALSFKALSPVVRPESPDSVQMYDASGYYLDGAYSSDWRQPRTTVLVIDVKGY